MHSSSGIRNFLTLLVCLILEHSRYNLKSNGLRFKNFSYPCLTPRISAAFLKRSAHICSPAEPRSCPTDLTTAISEILQLRTSSNAFSPCKHQKPFKKEKAEKIQPLDKRESRIPEKNCSAKVYNGSCMSEVPWSNSLGLWGLEVSASCRIILCNGSWQIFF